MAARCAKPSPKPPPTQPVAEVVLFSAQEYFALTYWVVVQPEAVLVRSRFCSRANRTAQQAHSCRSLKYVRRKRAAARIELDSQAACIGKPRNLVGGIQHHRLRDQADQHRTLSHDEISGSTTAPAASAAWRDTGR